jgi:hypothetical protein
MSSGIYLLDFRSGGCYIGKSVNIERRWEEHIKSLSEGKSAKKLQDAYKRYGIPSRSILLLCHEDHISLMETIMIRRLKPTLNSASTAPITLEDIDTLCSNGTHLASSTGTLIKQVCALGSHVTRLENEIEFLLDEDDVAYELYSIRKKFKELQLSNFKTISELEKEKKITWWQRLWR